MTPEDAQKELDAIYKDWHRSGLHQKYNNHSALLERWSSILANLEQAALCRFQAQCMNYPNPQ